MSAGGVKEEPHAWEEISELACLVQHNAAARLQLLEVEDMLVAWMDLPPESPVLHLPPASPYFRMLVHRLVEAFRVTHVSFGEGEDRHIVLQRNEDSRIPPVLLLDVLNVADGPSVPAAAPQILWRSSADRADGIPPPSAVPAQLPSLFERQQAYEEARARIFARDYSDGVGGSCEDYEQTAGRERRVPVVAQRLIGRALGVATGGTRGGENLHTGQNRSGSGENDQPGLTRSTKELPTGGRGPGGKTEGGVRMGQKIGRKDGIEKEPLAGVSRGGERKGRGGAGVTTETASVGEEVERRGGAEDGVRFLDAGRGKGKADTDCEEREAADCGDGLQQRGLGSACEEPVTRSGGGTESERESGGEPMGEWKSHRRGGRKRATKARRGETSNGDVSGRGADLDGQVEETKEGESGERNGVQNSDEGGAFGHTRSVLSDTGGAKVTSLGGDNVGRKAGRSPGQEAGARMFRLALPRGPVGPRIRTDKGVRPGELPEDETSAGERSCRESGGTSDVRDVSDVENGRFVSNLCSGRREESSTRETATDPAEQNWGDGHGSCPETSSAVESVETTVKPKGLPVVAGKMLSHALGLTQRGWGQVGRR